MLPQKLRKWQKPVLFGLAVLLMITFGLPSLVDPKNEGSDIESMPYIGSDGQPLTIDGRQITLGQWREMARRIIAANWDELRDADLTNESINRIMQQQMLIVSEARNAGLTVSPEERDDLITRHNGLRRRIDIEMIYADFDSLKSDIELTDDELAAYYEEHKDEFLSGGGDDSYSPFEEVEDEIRGKLLGERAEELANEKISDAMERAKGGELGRNGFRDVADDLEVAYIPLRGLENNQRRLWQLLGRMASNEDLTGKAFTAPLGTVFGPYDIDEGASAGKYMFRVTGRSAGYDADGTYHSEQLGWTGNVFGTTGNVGYAELVSRAFSISPAAFRLAIEERLLVEQYASMLEWSTALPTDTVEQEYYRRNEKVSAGILSFMADFYKTRVTVSDDEVREYYERYKDTAPQQPDAPGYLQPEKTKVEYILAKQEEPAAYVSDDELLEWYEENKHRYVIPKPVEETDDSALEEGEATDAGNQPQTEDETAGVKETAAEEEAVPEDAVTEEAIPVDEAATDKAAANEDEPDVQSEAAADDNAAAQDEAAQTDEEVEYLPFEEIKDIVKADRAEAVSQKRKSDLVKAAGEIEQRIASGKTPDMQGVAAKYALQYKKTPFFGRDGRDFFRAFDYTFARDRESVIAQVFSPDYKTDADLQLPPEDAARQRKMAISRISELQNGSTYFFRVIQRKEPEAVPFDELDETMRKTVRDHKITGKALELAEEDAKRMRGILLADAFDAIAADAGVEPAETESFAAGSLPESIPADAPLAQARDLQPNEMSQVVEDGDMLNIVLVVPTGENDDVFWKILRFPHGALKGPAYTDEEIAEHVRGNIERYADIAAPKGAASISYIAAEYETIAEGLPEPTDEEIDDYLATHEVDTETETEIETETETEADDEADTKVDTETETEIETEIDDEADTKVDTETETEIETESADTEEAEGEATVETTVDTARKRAIAAIKMQKAREDAVKLIDEAIKKAQDGADFWEIVDETPLVQRNANNIKLEDTAATDFVGKAENLARLILSTKVDEIAGPLATEDGMFFLKVATKNPAKGAELIEGMTEEHKSLVRDHIAAGQASASPVESARFQRNRHIEQVFRNASENYPVFVKETLSPYYELRRISETENARFDDELAEKLRTLEPGTLTGTIASGNSAGIYYVKNRLPIHAARMEYVSLSVDSFVVDDPELDWSTRRAKAREQAGQAANKLHAAAEELGSLREAVESLEGELTLHEHNKPSVSTSTWFLSTATTVPGLGRNLDVYSRINELEAGELVDVQNDSQAFSVMSVKDIRPNVEAKVSYVRVYPFHFRTEEMEGEEYQEIAQQAMEALRAAAVEKGSLDDAIDVLNDRLPERYKATVEHPEEYANIKDGISGLRGRTEFVAAALDTEPGGFTPVVLDAGALYLAQVHDSRNAEFTTVEMISMRDTQFSDPEAALPRELEAYYEANKEKYRRESTWKVQYVQANSGDYRIKAFGAATDEALRTHFEENKDKWQSAGEDDQPVEAVFEDVREQVRDSFVAETSERLAAESLEAVRGEIEPEFADMKTIAEENELEFRDFADLTRTQIENRREFIGIPNIVETLTAMHQGEVSSVIAGPRSTYYLFKVVDHTESQVPSFEEMKRQVAMDLDAERRVERMNRTFDEQRVKERLETALAEGTTFAEAAGAIKLDVTRHRRLVYRATDRFGRRLLQSSNKYTGGTIPGMPGNQYKLVETVFKLQPGQISEPVREDDRRDAINLAIQREFVVPDPPTQTQLDGTRSTLQRIVQQNLQNETIDQIILRSFGE